MKLSVYLVFLLGCFMVFSCSHNPYRAFEDISVGDDKSVVLDKVGSPLRSFHKDGKNIWTYRFYNKADDSFIYKDIILDTTNVLEIRDSQVVNIQEIERKEKLVEESIKEDLAAPKKSTPAPTKPPVDDSILTDTSKPKADDFKPVE